MSDTTYALGDRVAMTGTVVKTHVYEDNSVLTKYTEVPLPRDRGVPVTEGIIVGKRSLRNGHLIWNPLIWNPMYDASWLPDPTSFTVYLVAYSLMRKTVMCLPNQLTPISDED